MADDAADKDAKNADESAVTSDAEKAESSSPSSAAVESTAEGTTEAAAAEVADFDAEDSEKAKDSGAVEDSDDEDISLEPDEEQNPKRIRGRHWALTAAAIVAIAIVALAAIIGRLYEEQRIEEQSSRGSGGGAGIRQRHDQRGQRQARRELQQDLERSTGDFKQKYSESSTTLRQVMIENKAKATGVVVDSAVKSATPDKVEVLLFIDQAVSNVAIPDAHGPKPGADNDAEGRRPLACQRC